MRQVLTGCVALLLAGTAAGQIMECIDAKGNKTITQFCPPGTVKETQLMRSGAGASSGGSAAPAAATKSIAEREAEFRKRPLERQEAEAKADKEKNEARDTERNCNDARAQLRAMQDGGRVARTNPDTGERTFIDDKDRPAEIANAQKAVDNWCKKK
jgi:hypothetical protein